MEKDIYNCLRRRFIRVKRVTAKNAVKSHRRLSRYPSFSGAKKKLAGGLESSLKMELVLARHFPSRRRTSCCVIKRNTHSQGRKKASLTFTSLVSLHSPWTKRDSSWFNGFLFAFLGNFSAITWVLFPWVNPVGT